MAAPALTSELPLDPFDDAYVDALDEQSLRIELKERNRHVRLLAERSSDLVVLSSTDGRWVYANARSEAALGYRPEELFGRSFYEFAHPDEGELLAAHHQRVLTSNEDFAGLEHQLRRRDGTYTWVTAAIETTQGREDRRHVLVIDRFDAPLCEDANRPFDSARRNFRLLAEASIDMIARQTPDHRLIYVSPASRALLGYAPSEIIGKDPVALCHPDDLAAVGMAYEVLSTGESDDFSFEDSRLWLEIRGNVARVRCRLRHRDRHYVWCEQVITGLRGEDGTLEEFVTVTRDITRVKLHERELEAINRQLEERILERTAALASSNSELRAALEALESARDKLVQAEKLSSLGELVAGIAHEVNTPVGVGLTAASHLCDRARAFEADLEAGKLTRRALADFVRVANESAGITVSNLQRAAQLIRSFKKVAADRSHESVRELEITEYVDEVLLSLRPQIRREGHVATVTGPVGVRIKTAPGALSQVVTNFVMNALRHAFEGRDAGTLEIVVDALDDGGCTIAFRDDGVGIPPQHLKRIFDPFFTTKRGQGGTGLGLNIVYGLITNVLQGSVEVDSTRGSGTTFVVRLPRVLDETPSPPPTDELA